MIERRIVIEGGKGANKTLAQTADRIALTQNECVSTQVSDTWGVRNVIELLHTMTTNDDLYVAQNIFCKQLMSEPKYRCNSNDLAVSLINEAVVSGYALRFRRAGGTTDLLCLPRCYTACMEPFPSCEIDTSEEEIFVVEVLKKHNGSMRRSLLTVLLWDCFSSMRDFVMRKALYRNAESKGLFFVAKNNYGHVVGLTRCQAWSQLYYLSHKSPAESIREGNILDFVIHQGPKASTSSNTATCSMKSVAAASNIKKDCRAIQKVVELLNTIATNDDLFVGTSILRKQLMLRYPAECGDSATATSWIADAVANGCVKQITIAGSQTEMLCLPWYSSACTSSQDFPTHVDTSEEEIYVRSLLQKHNACMRRSLLVVFLKDKFVSMRHHFMRRILYRNAAQNGSFFVAKEHHCHMVGLTYDVAKNALEHLSFPSPIDEFYLHFPNARKRHDKTTSVPATSNEFILIQAKKRNLATHTMLTKFPAVELVQISAKNDEIYVAEEVVLYQLMTKWAQQCQSIQEARKWIDQGVDAGELCRFTRPDIPTATLICLAQNHEACLAPFPSHNVSTDEEIKFVISLLQKNGGTLSRPALTLRLKQTFSSMATPFMRRKLYLDAKAKDCFFVVRGCDGHVVGLTRVDAFRALCSMNRHVQRK